MANPPTRIGHVLVPDEGELGPAMQALTTDRMRAFVIALVNQGGRDQTRAYAEAGYEAQGVGARVNSHRLAHDERIIAAIKEESQKRLGFAAIAASSFLVEVINDDDPKVKVSDKMRAAGMILNRTGLHETNETVVTHKHEPTEEEKIEKAISLAKQMGLDPQVLLGNIGIKLNDDGTPANVIDGEATLVGSTEGLEDIL